MSLARSPADLKGSAVVQNGRKKWLMMT